jgi:putative nucleotidyltransferase with HDIG domain
MEQDPIAEIEAYVRPLMTSVIAHDYKHVDRVRRWAIRLAAAEGYADIQEVEAAALLHDIGLSKDAGRKHAEIGAVMAEEFLRNQGSFDEPVIARIVDAIRHHSALHGQGRLFQILQDADGLELFGAIGLLRGIASKATLPDYDPANVKGDTWLADAAFFSRRFTSGQGVGATIIDQLNFQISCFENLHTDTARQCARPMVNFMKTYLLQLEAEICRPV